MFQQTGKHHCKIAADLCQLRQDKTEAHTNQFEVVFKEKEFLGTYSQQFVSLASWAAGPMPRL